MKIKLIGDTHGQEMKKIIDNLDADYLIVLGDFGYYEEELTRLAYLLKETRCYLCFLDGNHEYFPELQGLPEVSFLGGKAGKVAHNIFWLKRGEVYSIGGYRFLVFGGAYSIDKNYRIPGESWFEMEEYNEMELENLKCNIAKYQGTFDYILTHDAPKSIAEKIIPPYLMVPNRTITLLETIKKDCRFQHWYFGHHHIDWDWKEFTCLWESYEIINLK